METSNKYINGDDCITVKSGSRDVLVEDLYCEHGDGLTIGSIWYRLTPRPNFSLHARPLLSVTRTQS